MFAIQTIINQLYFPGTFLICTALVTLPCFSRVVTFLEDEQAYLHFTYSCDIYEVVLQAGYNAPFFHSRNGGSLSLPLEQKHRFIVDIVNRSYGCSLNLTIMNVHKDDAATYICSIYKDIESVQNYEYIGLHIDFPPGKATCQLNPQHQEGSWGSMQCTANVGSLLGQIECYQNNEKMPALTDPVENSTSLKQTILIKYSNIVFCCSATFKLPKAICECNDSIVDPIYNIHLNGRDVCPTTSPSNVLEPSSSKQSHFSRNTISTISEVATTETTPINVVHSNKTIVLVIWSGIVTVLALIFVIIVALLGRYIYMQNKGQRNLDGFSSYTEVNNEETENKNGTDTEATNMQLTELENGKETETQMRIEIEKTILKIDETPL